MSTTTKTGLIPTKTEAIEAAKSLGGLSLGMIVAYNISNFTKTQKPIVQNSISGAMVLGGAIGFIKAKNSLLKHIALGAAAFGVFKLIGAGTKIITDPATTSGIGFLTPAIKESIRKFLPTFAGIDEVSGFGNVDDVSGDNDFNMPSLNDAGEPTVGNDNTENYSGVGSMLEMAG